ncbi:MAG: DNA starvation/stationary phase protection protein [Bacteroidetes bacterium]|nr:DNA starvation/stationary phase protection protein [Bacteroidota bacterium]
MNDTNFIGIDSADAVELAEKLNDLLSNYQVYYQNIRGFHWNIKGEQFFQLHAKFEELYNLAAIAIDEIAERILTLDHIPLHSYSNYVKISEIRETTNITEGKECVEYIVNNVKTLVDKQKKILEIANEAGDEGTADLMTGYISAQEKLLWMLNAYLKK